MARTALRCAKCGSTQVKRYPQDFPHASDWPGPVSMKVRMAGGPDPSRPILVCTACGHNMEPGRGPS